MMTFLGIVIAVFYAAGMAGTRYGCQSIMDVQPSSGVMTYGVVWFTALVWPIALVFNLTAAHFRKDAADLLDKWEDEAL